MHRFAQLLSLVIALSACGPDLEVHGRAYSVSSQVWFRPFEQTWIQLSTDSDACNSAPRGGARFFLLLHRNPGDAALTAGRYTITNNEQVSASVFAYDPDCSISQTASASSVSGYVELGSVTGNLAGSYDVVLDSGDHVSGPFDAAPSPCPATANEICR